MTSGRADENVRYEPNENPPRPITIGAGLQAAMIIVAPVVLTVVIVARIADMTRTCGGTFHHELPTLPQQG